MNKKVYVSFALLLLVLWLISAESNELPEITVNVNPNFELLAVVYTLATGENMIADQEYFDDLIEYFGNYKDHEAVKSIKQKLGFDYKRVEYFFIQQQRLLLNTSDPPEMKSDTEDNFIDLLRDFAVKTNFMEFYNEHQSYYQKYYDFLYENTAIKEVPSLFNNFFGVSMNEMHIESSYSYIPGSPHAHWETKKYESIIGYFFMNHCYLPKNESEILSREVGWNHLMLHEFGHTAAYMLENYGKMHQPFSYILDPARLDIRQGWGYITVDHSYIIEPFAAWGLDQIYGEPWGELEISQNCSIGLHIVPAVYKLYKEDYMPNRDIYPTFDSYIPRLCEKLEEIVTPYTTHEYYEKTMYTSVLQSFYGNNPENKLLIIYGTQNPDPTGTEHDKKVAEEWAQYFLSDMIVDVIADTEVTETDLSEHNFLLIGGPVANKITKELNENLPIKFEEENEKWGIVHNLPQDTLVFSGFYDTLVKSIEKERYEDPNIRVMEAFRNPYNEEKYGVLIAGNAREGTTNVIMQRILYSLACSYQISGNIIYEQGFYVIKWS